MAGTRTESRRAPCPRSDRPTDDDLDEADLARGRPQPAAGRFARRRSVLAQLDDAALLILAREEPDAFGEFFDRHCDRIYRHLLLMTQDRQAAENLTGEVFSTALRALDGDLPQSADVALWLYRITEATLAAHPPVHPTRPRALGARGAASRAVGRTRLDERVLQALDALPDPAQRSVLLLRLGQNLSVAEIAAVLPFSQHDVVLLLRQGLIAMKDALAE